jgi:GntR family transcriptional regulator, sialic acid-inducible nan operon repressor
MPEIATPARGGRAAESIAAALIADVQGGQIDEGENFPSERELCERFDVSRPTIREALSLVRQKGFADLSTSRRPRAIRPSFTSLLEGATTLMRDLLDDMESIAYMEQVRQFIEVGAVRLIAKSATTVQLARLNAALEACRAVIGDADRFKTADIAFHRALVSFVDNPILLTLHDTFAKAMFDRRPKERDPKAHNQMVYDEHRAVLEAIAEGDGDRAAKVMEEHLARSYRSILPIFRQAERDAAADQKG